MFKPIDPARLDALLDEQRTHWARMRYREEQQVCITAGVPLLPEFDSMNEADRIVLGLYDGYVERRPEDVSPIAWELMLRERAERKAWAARTPTALERERGYDFHGKPC